tara:strand:+ start:459 stop:686 length:228 start_codon:yes stop_codon:yes gene_type:complete
MPESRKSVTAAEVREELSATLNEAEYRLRPAFIGGRLAAWASKSFEKDSKPWILGTLSAVVGGFMALLWAVSGKD